VIEIINRKVMHRLGAEELLELGRTRASGVPERPFLAGQREEPTRAPEPRNLFVNETPRVGTNVFLGKEIS
jgi:hypothetical protein